MSERWSDWIEHDGAAPMLPVGRYAIQSAYAEGSGYIPAEGAVITGAWPGWFWRWRRVRTGWFRRELRRVCDDPAYAPIIRYRYRKPPGLVVLEEIAAGVRTPQTETVTA